MNSGSAPFAASGEAGVSVGGAGGADGSLPNCSNQPGTLSSRRSSGVLRASRSRSSCWRSHSSKVSGSGCPASTASSACRRCPVPGIWAASESQALQGVSRRNAAWCADGAGRLRQGLARRAGAGGASRRMRPAFPGGRGARLSCGASCSAFELLRSNRMIRCSRLSSAGKSVHQKRVPGGRSAGLILRQTRIVFGSLLGYAEVACRPPARGVYLTCLLRGYRRGGSARPLRPADRSVFALASGDAAALASSHPKSPHQQLVGRRGKARFGSVRGSPTPPPPACWRSASRTLARAGAQLPPELGGDGRPPSALPDLVTTPGRRLGAGPAAPG